MQTLESMQAFFMECGGTDKSYLDAHYARFKRTYEFVDGGLLSPSTILDIGCHWLHLSALFANGKNKIIGADAPNTLRYDAVKKAANSLGVRLISYTRLDLGQGICELESDSVDLILMSEILEHLAFNPLVFWKEVHRVLKDGGRLIITTPNGLYFRTIFRAYNDLFKGMAFGCSIKDILDTGTYGHHWREYSVKDIDDYFKYLDCGFTLSKISVETLGKSISDEKLDCFEYIASLTGPYIDFGKVLGKLENDEFFPYGNQIFSELTLNKCSVFKKKPPWLVE